VVNKVPTSSPICDHCDIFAAARGKRGAEVRPDIDWHLKRRRLAAAMRFVKDIESFASDFSKALQMTV
jgi:hypothetical protein